MTNHSTTTAGTLPTFCAFANAMLTHLTGTLGMSWTVAANAMLRANFHGDAYLPEHYLTADSQSGVAVYRLYDA